MIHFAAAASLHFDDVRQRLDPVLLRDMAGMDRAGIAGVLFWTAAAMTAGYVIVGFITESRWLWNRLKAD